MNYDMAVKQSGLPFKFDKIKVLIFKNHPFLDWCIEPFFSDIITQPVFFFLYDALHLQVIL